MNGIKEGGYLICIREYTYLSITINVGDKCCISSISKTSPTGDWILNIVNAKNELTYITLRFLPTCFETISKHRKRIIEDFI